MVRFSFWRTPAAQLARGRGAALVAALLLLTLSACGEADYRPNAVGPEGRITVVIDSARWNGAVGEAVREHIGTPINTLPQPEPSFELEVRTLGSTYDLDQIKKRKNVLLVAPLSDSTNEAQVLRSSLSADARQAVEAGQSVVAPRSDLWRRGQQVFYLTADTPERLAETIRQRGESIRDTFNVVTRVRTGAEMFEKGRQFALEDTLMQKHDFAVNVQHDYFIAVDTATDSTGFVWLRRVVSSESWRSLFVYYLEGADPSTITPEWVLATRDSLAREYLRGNVDGYTMTDRRGAGGRDYLDVEQADFLGRFAYEARGLWIMAERGEDGQPQLYGGGGPFVNYTFYDQGQDRIYMLDGMVFAPGYDKREFLRQMEVIAHTFRTRTENGSGALAASE